MHIYLFRFAAAFSPLSTPVRQAKPANGGSDDASCAGGNSSKARLFDFQLELKQGSAFCA
jgi:hypothetical protein